MSDDGIRTGVTGKDVYFNRRTNTQKRLLRSDRQVHCLGFVVRVHIPRRFRFQ